MKVAPPFYLSLFSITDGDRYVNVIMFQAAQAIHLNLAHCQIEALLQLVPEGAIIFLTIDKKPGALKGALILWEDIMENTVATEKEAEQGEYGLHIRLSREMQPALKDAAELAYKMGDIPKGDLVDLINLFIVWGLSIQKKRWLDRMGYK